MKHYVQNNIGSSKYILNVYDGVKKHNDGSDFYDIFIFKSKKTLNAKKSTLSNSHQSK